jgi:hypothetical protein
MDLPVTARIKPENRILEQEHSLEVGGENYDTMADEYLQIQRQLLRATHVDLPTHFAVGVMKEGELHLTPCENIYQMRPTFDHINANDDDLGKGEEVDVKAENKKKEITKLGVEFKKKESIKSIESRKRSYAHKKRVEDSEEWVELLVHGQDTEESKEQHDRMVYTGDAKASFDMEASDYVSSLHYMSQINRAQVGTVKSTSGTNIEDLKEIPAQDTIRAMFNAAQLLTLGQVCAAAVNLKHRREMLLRDLVEVAVLVHDPQRDVDVWVLKSGLAFENDPEHERLVDYRDAMLIQLRRNRPVSRQQIGDGELLLASRQKIDKMLKGVCVLNKEQRRWYLKVEPCIPDATPLGLLGSRKRGETAAVEKELAEECRQESAQDESSAQYKTIVAEQEKRWAQRESELSNLLKKWDTAVAESPRAPLHPKH